MAVSKVVSLNLSQNGPLEVKVTHVKVKVAFVKVKLALVKLKVTFVKVTHVKVKVISLSLSQNGPCFQNTNICWTLISSHLWWLRLLEKDTGRPPLKQEAPRF